MTYTSPPKAGQCRQPGCHHSLNADHYIIDSVNYPRGPGTTTRYIYIKCDACGERSDDIHPRVDREEALDLLTRP